VLIKSSCLMLDTVGLCRGIFSKISMGFLKVPSNNERFPVAD
jgi:hypothetical protein